MSNEFGILELNLLSVTLYQARERDDNPALKDLHDKVYAMLEARCEELDREVKHARNEVAKEKKLTFMHGDEELTMLITIL